MESIDYYILIIEHINLYNATFEFWLSITFAFIAVFHFAKDGLSNKFLNLLILLYGAASALFVARFVGRVIAMNAIYSNIREGSIDPPPWNNEYAFGGFIILGFIALMIAGSIASVYFAVKQTRTRNDT